MTIDTIRSPLFFPGFDDEPIRHVVQTALALLPHECPRLGETR